MKNKKGFTLVELVIAVSLIGVVAWFITLFLGASSVFDRLKEVSTPEYIASKTKECEKACSKEGFNFEYNKLSGCSCVGK